MVKCVHVACTNMTLTRAQFNECVSSWYATRTSTTTNSWSVQHSNTTTTAAANWKNLEISHGLMKLILEAGTVQSSIRMRSAFLWRGKIRSTLTPTHSYTLIHSHSLIRAHTHHANHAECSIFSMFGLFDSILMWRRWCLINDSNCVWRVHCVSSFFAPSELTLC